MSARWTISPRTFSSPEANWSLQGWSAGDVYKRQDKRLAEFLLEEAAIEGTDQLKITHETIANHLGSHREVITRMLRYFQNEGMVKLSRGMVTLLDQSKLKALVQSGE